MRNLILSWVFSFFSTSCCCISCSKCRLNRFVMQCHYESSDLQALDLYVDMSHLETTTKKGHHEKLITILVKEDIKLLNNEI